LGAEANELIWEKKMSTTEAIRRARELVEKCNALPKSAASSKKWVKETFGSMDELFKNVMALHVAVFTCRWQATSGVENVFNVFKKFRKGLLKRSVLYDAVMELLELVQRRLQNDSMLMQSHPDWFIDMRVFEDPKKDRKKQLSTRQLFTEELTKLQNGSKCPWTGCIPVAEKKMWLVLENHTSGHQTVHLVDLNGFLWADTDENIPPKCHTCPCYRNGRTPCIGILTVLQNLQPLTGPSTVSLWLRGKGLERPEIFDNRWRVDKDPTMHLSEFLLAPRPQRNTRPQTLPLAPIIPADLLRKFEGQLSRAQQLNPASQATLLAHFSNSLSNNEGALARFELDVKIHQMTKSRGVKRTSTIDLKDGKGHSSKPKRFQANDSSNSGVARAKRQRPAGTSDGIPEEDKWSCIVCHREVVNTQSSVKQHCDGTTHKKNMEKWKAQGSQPEWVYVCKVAQCSHTFVENDPQLQAQMIRQHRQKKHVYHCEVCNQDVQNTPKGKQDHFDSNEHQQQVRLQNEQHRPDAVVCAQNQRDINGAAASKRKKSK
jgi:hypothetical protein